MDEPLAALDTARKNEIIPYLERLHDELEIPILYVTHSLDEVARLADHMVVLEKGRVVASGETVDLMTQVESLAHGDSAGSVILATVTGHDAAHHLTHVEFPGGRLSHTYHAADVGHQVRLRIQARDVSLTLERQTGTSILNILPATVQCLSDDSPGQVMVTLDLSGTRLLARITSKSVAALDLTLGKPVYAQIKGVAVLR